MSLKRTRLYALAAVSITNSEYSIPNAATRVSDTSPTPIATPVVAVLVLDPTNIVDGDEFIARCYDKIRSGGTQRLLYERRFCCTDGRIWMLPDAGGIALLHAWDWTLQRLSANSRTLSGRIEVSQGSNITELFGGTNVTIGTEYDFVAGSTSIGTKTDQPAYIQVFIHDRGNMVKGDEFQLTISEAAAVGSTRRTLLEERFHDVQDRAIWTPWIPVRDGYAVTLKKISASDRAFDYSVRGMS